MFDWFKPKKPPEKPVAAAKAPQTRDEIVAGALKNARIAREAIGEDTLAKLSALILQKQNQLQDTSPPSPPVETSPATQAKKIIAQMDKDKVADFLKMMVRDEQTRH